MTRVVEIRSDVRENTPEVTRVGSVLSREASGPTGHGGRRVKGPNGVELYTAHRSWFKLVGFNVLRTTEELRQVPFTGRPWKSDVITERVDGGRSIPESVGVPESGTSISGCSPDYTTEVPLGQKVTDKIRSREKKDGYIRCDSLVDDTWS